MMNEMKELMREEFDKWRDAMFRGIKREYKDYYFTNAWAMKAYIAKLEKDQMGQDFNRLQQRIHRQRLANREQQSRIEALEEAKEELMDYITTLEEGIIAMERREG